MIELGLSISSSKCTTSEHGFAEFAKRLFTPYGEVTGIPVDILKEVKRQPEQLIELIRLMRLRGYTDKQIIPGIQSLTKFWKNRNLVLDLLSVPEIVSGSRPLALNLDNEQSFDWSSVTFLEEISSLAREELFWRKVNLLVQSAYSEEDSVLSNLDSTDFIQPNHPLYVGVGEKMLDLLDRRSK